MPLENQSTGGYSDLDWTMRLEPLFHALFGFTWEHDYYTNPTRSQIVENMARTSIARDPASTGDIPSKTHHTQPRKPLTRSYARNKQHRYWPVSTTKHVGGRPGAIGQTESALVLGLKSPR